MTIPPVQTANVPGTSPVLESKTKQIWIRPVLTVAPITLRTGASANTVDDGSMSNLFS